MAGDFINAPANLLTSETVNILYLLGYINSSVFNWCFIKLSGIPLGQAFEWKKQYVEQIFIPDISNNVQNILSDLVDKIQHAEKQNNSSLSMKYQKQIDKILYEYYDFDIEQIKIIENLL